MGMQIALKRFYIAESALGFDKSQFHQRAGRVINEDEQGAGITSIFKPEMIRAVDLD